MRGHGLAALIALGLVTQALALNPSPAPRAERERPGANEPLVAIEVMTGLSSQTSHRGDMFPIRLVEPVMVDGEQVLAAGALGVGEVIEAKPARGGGTPGILTLGLRYLEVGGRQIPLRLADPTMKGRDRMAGDLKSAERNVFISPIRTLPLNLITVFREGGEVALAAGTRTAAYLTWQDGVAAVAAPSDKRALVVFFRPAALSWRAIGCTVSEDGRKVSSLGSGRWFAASVSPGTHIFRATGETRDELRMDLAAGQVAYVACRMRMSALIARPTLMPASKSEYGAQKLKMIDEDDMGLAEAGALRGDAVMGLPMAMRP